MNAFIRLNRGIMKMPLYVQLWLMCVVTINMVVPLFYLGRVEAQLVLGAAMAGMIIQTLVVAFAGFTRLLGLGHVMWFPL